MKKLLSLLLVLFMSFSLASCGDSKQNVTIKNEKGEDVEVTLEETDNEEVIKNAITYALQADYTTLKLVNASLDAKVDATLNQEENIHASANLSAAADLENVILYLESSASLNGAMKNLDPETNEEVLEPHTASANAHLAFAMPDMLLDPNVYVGYQLKEDEAETEAKLKISVEDIMAFISGFLPEDPNAPETFATDETPDAPGLPEIPGLPELPEINLPTSEELSELLKQIKELMPNSKLKISKVNNDKFTITYDLSVKDALEKVDAINNTDYARKLENDFKVAFNIDFEIKTGRFLGFGVNVSNAFFLDLVFEGKEISKKAEAKLSLSLDINYNGEAVKRLTAAEKALYEDLNQPID